ncbi:hypothetical protein D3875_02915 [Deinococcus cavernae]|uniref:Uncharacterized protein n=1 Tax=Deinococcus cavernae TaxID=2320857 RepID=A0A418VFR3_9DEIO|nr:hypothetical protein D3875_02915 [Deinococcus cavernae]
MRVGDKVSRDLAPTPTVEAIGELHLEGNIIPHTFYTRREFKSDRGVTQHLAILIYADDLYWYRPTLHRDERTGKVTHVTRKFREDMLQRSYDYYAELFGVTKQQATDAVKLNVDRGLTRREFRTIRAADGKKISNVMFVEPRVEAVKTLLKIDEPQSGGWYWVAEPPRPNLKKQKGEGIPNKPDTYPEHSGYLSRTSGRRIRNKPETNTEITQETSSKTSSSSVPVDAGTDWLPDDDDFPADAEPQNPNPTPEAPHQPDQVQPSSQAAETPPPTDPENVPGAAGGAAAPAWAILALPVIPRGELEARAPRDPSGIPQLRALLHCSHKSRLPQLQVELEAATRSGIPRALLTRLTDQELKAATSAAKTDAPKVEGGFARAGIHALHRLIGESLTPALLKGEKEPARDVRGAAYDVKNEPSGKAAQVETLPPPSPVSIEAGSRWEHRRQQDKVVTVVGIKSGKVEFHNGEQVLAYQLTKDYRRVD